MSESPPEEVHCSMTSEERKSKYRDLLDQVETLHENEEVSYNKTKILDQIIGDANVLFKDSNIKERIKHTDEVLLDAKVVATASNVLLHITESIDCAIDTYEHLDLARKINAQLLSYDDPDDIDYTKVAIIANNIIKQPPTLLFFYGEIGKLNVNEKPVKIRKSKTQKEKQENVTKKVPEKVIHISKEEESVDDTVKFIQWALNKECEQTGKKHLNYLNFIIDPHNFSKTIENMFHFSFLVRDGKVQMDIDNAGVIQITPLSSYDSKKAKKSGILYRQSIITINMSEWQAIVKATGIKNCFLSKWKSKWESKKNYEHV